MGPQVGYFSPEILMEEDIHGPGIDADRRRIRRAQPLRPARPRTRLRVVGDLLRPEHHRHVRGAAVQSGRRSVGLDSDYYLLPRHVLAMETLTDHESWTAEPRRPDAGGLGHVHDPAHRVRDRDRARDDRWAAGRLLQPALDLHARARLGAGLRALQRARATCADPQDFFNAADQIGYTFNWFYADDRTSPTSTRARTRCARPTPTRCSRPGRQDSWVGYQGGAPLTPAGLTEQRHARARTRRSIDQPFLTSWNNKQAPGYNDAATAQEFSSVYRSQLLDRNIEHYLAHARQAHARRPDQRDGQRRHPGSARRRGAAVRAQGDRPSERPRRSRRRRELHGLGRERLRTGSTAQHPGASAPISRARRCS